MTQRMRQQGAYSIILNNKPNLVLTTSRDSWPRQTCQKSWLGRMMRSVLGRIFNLEVLDEERGESGHGDKKADKRSEAPHTYTGDGVLKKRESLLSRRARV